MHDPVILRDRRSPEAAWRLARRHASDRRFRAFGIGAVTLSLCIPTVLLIVMVAHGLGGLSRHFFTASASTDPALAGLWGAAKGSLLTMLVTLFVSLPMGVLTAIYLEEFAPRNRWTGWIEGSIGTLAAVPSILFGLLGLAVFIGALGMPPGSPLVGGLTLAAMTMPVIVIASRHAIRAVPSSLRDAALALGASRMQASIHHVLPLAMPGIVSGGILGMARALGETAPLLLIGMRVFVAGAPSDLTQPASVLPMQVFLWSQESGVGFVRDTSAAILVLLAVLFAMNGLAVHLRAKYAVRW